jgi:hypothetical protein
MLYFELKQQVSALLYYVTDFGYVRKKLDPLFLKVTSSHLFNWPYLKTDNTDCLHGMMVNLCCQKMTLANMWCDVEKTEHHLNSLAKNMRSNGQPFKYRILCRYTGHLIPVPKG